jgi:D-arabinose 1-dehydrogenase-like Zn-dependent alcohol dehydrogenase
MMKAAVIERFPELVVRELPEPQVGDYDVLCELLFGATCTGTDSHIIAGTFPWIGSLPTILGHESVGRAVKLGRKVRHFRVGDLITRVGTPPVGGCSVTWGGFAEWGLARDHWAMAADGLPATEWQSYRVNQVIPAGIEPRQAPMFITWRETLSWLQRLGFQAGQRLLVIGSGGNGLSIATHARNLGAAAIAMVGAPRLAEAARRHAGIGCYLDYHLETLVAPLQAAVPEGFDVIVDALGRPGLADRVLPVLRPGGTFAVYGLDQPGQATLNPALARGPFRCYYMGSYDEAESHQQVCDFVRQGKLSAQLWYDPAHCYPLAQIADAYAAVRDRRSVKALVQLRG